MKTTKGKLRNITTGILHTKMSDVYDFFEEYTGEEGIMTHLLPSAKLALMPVLRARLTEDWFNKEWVKTGLDEEVEISEMNEEEKKSFWTAFGDAAATVWDKMEKR